MWALVATFIKSTTDTLTEFGVAGMFTHWPIYALVAGAIARALLQQAALHARRAVEGLSALSGDRRSDRQHRCRRAFSPASPYSPVRQQPTPVICGGLVLLTPTRTSDHGRRSPRLGAEPCGELLRVHVRVVAVAVVEQHVGFAFFSASSFPPCTFAPCRCTYSRTSLRCSGSSHLSECPCIRTTARSLVAATARGMGLGWRLRHVHAPAHHLLCSARKSSVSFWLFVGHPGVVAELHAHPPRRGPLRARHDVLLVRPRDREPRRELEQDRAELARARAAAQARRGTAPTPGRPPPGRRP